MLIVLENGDQRLISFTMPHETCTVQELLERFEICVPADSRVQCLKYPGSEIEYFMKIGNSSTIFPPPARQLKVEKMLVIFKDGHQKQITYMPPSGTCLLRDLLSQVGVEVDGNCKIEGIECPGSEINYIVKIGDFSSNAANVAGEQREDPEKHKTKLPPFKYSNGINAICPTCGSCGTNHKKCEECFQRFNNPRRTLSPKTKYCDMFCFMELIHSSTR